MLVNIILFVIMWFVGLCVYSFFIMQIVLSVSCSIPLTKKFSPQCKCLVDENSIYRKIAFTIVICVIIFSLILLGVLYWGNRYVEYGFFIGLVVAFIFSFGKWGITPNNTQDYFSTYHKYYARKDLLELGIIQE